MSKKTNQKIEIWKKKLLDMGMRNRLLNYKDTKRTSLNILTPDYMRLYKLVVLDEKTLAFPHIELKTISADDYFSEAEDQERVQDPKIYEIPGDIVTDKTVKETHQIAKALRDKTKTAYEEQGVNILYLSFGFLEWTDRGKASASVASPLVLVPVILSIESIADPYVLSLHEDEVVVNPTLAYKLENDFGITLPAFDAQNDDLEQYLSSIEKIVDKLGWRVNRRVSLSMLSFLKINMYKDLEQHKDMVSKHPIIKALSGEPVEQTADVSAMAHYDHDKEDAPANTFQVVDADSSQQDAIVMSKRGVSFALQGPPGTGKSQTITNIISEALADGKKVLFVSEKMAALEVVYRRLAASGLDGFCLVLHSNKANKREFLDSFRKVLELKPIELRDSALYKLKALQDRRERLDAYCEELHRVIEPLHQSVFEANGILAQLKDAPNIAFRMNSIDVAGITKEQFYSLRLAVAELAKTEGKLTEDYTDNTWRNTRIQSVSHEVRHDLSSHFDELISVFSGYLEKVKEFEPDLDFDLNVPFPVLPGLTEALHFCSSGEPFPEEWLEGCDLSALIVQARQEKSRQEHELDLEKRLSAYSSDAFSSFDAQEVKHQVDQDMESGRSILAERYADTNVLLSELDTLIETIERARLDLVHESQLIDPLSRELLLPKPTDQSQIADLCVFLRSYHQRIKASPMWFEPEWTRELRQEKCLSAQADIRAIDDLKAEILKDYEPEILNIDFQGILSRFKTEYTSFFRSLKSGYKADSNTIRALCRVPTRKVPHETMLQLLEKVKDYHGMIRDMEGKEYPRYLGGWFNGLTTDFSQITSAFDAFDAIRNAYGGRIPFAIRNVILTGGNEEQYASELEQLSAIRDGGRIDACSEICAFQTKDHPIDTLISSLSLAGQVLNRCRERLLAIPLERPIDSAVRYQAMADLAELQFMRNEDASEHDALCQSFFFLYNGFSTDWDHVLRLLEWVSLFKEYCAKYAFSPMLQKTVSSHAEQASVPGKVADYLQSFYEGNMASVERFLDSFTEDEHLQDMTIGGLKGKVHRCQTNLKGLEDWLDFTHAKEKCEQMGLSDFVASALKKKITYVDLESAFIKRFERLWLDKVTAKLPAIQAFRTQTQTDLISEFQSLDQEQMQIARSRIREKLINGLPNINSFTSARDEVGILLHELGKQRKIMPVRKMFDQMPNLLPRLKPCLMMSPLSVSQFLQSENYSFDLVIFDEASQVKTENAIGAISRGKQVVIAGDIHQLPPTNFFTSATSGADEFDEDEEDDSDAFESVLDETIDILPQLTLKWHYRSRNESLIAFSNRKIYNSSLVTFPSPSEEGENEGVEYVYVADGLYERGGKKNNPIEAKRVAEIIFEQIERNPNRSIGVITFSEAQQRCVEAAVIARRLSDPTHEDFFREDKDEAFFIKNLENVQGDERDTIIFSIGYGKANPLEELRMSFGPLNQSGGYRRLNVAVTRAKYSVKLVGSILPTDMRITETTPKGVKLLHDYIVFAQNGVRSLENEIAAGDVVQTESPFEDSVYDFLNRKGYQVATQVGCSGYRIDMAIKHPVLNGHFVLGVECDGASYHSSRTARERDRLRQAVLESMGWKLYRVWSTDWVKDPVTEGEHLVAAVEQALKAYAVSEPPKHQSPKTVDYKENDYAKTVARPVSADASGYGFEKFRETVFPVAETEKAAYVIADALNKIVIEQWPVHLQILCRQLAPLYGLKKATQRVKDGVNGILQRYQRQYGWVQKGDFIWPKGSKTAIPRVAGGTEKPRPLEYVAPEELSKAMRIIIDKSFGIDKNALYTVIAREYGFARTTAQMVRLLDAAFNQLMKSKMIKSIDGKLTIAK